jgi:histone chaperone ASF1
VLECLGPDIKAIPRKDVLGVTILMLYCAYKGREFLQIGYYVNNERVPANETEVVDENAPLDASNIRRNTWVKRPRVVRTAIQWN